MYLHLHEPITLSLFGALGPKVVLKYVALGFPASRQQQSLRISSSQVSVKTNEVQVGESLNQSEFFQMITSNAWYAKSWTEIL